MSIVDNLKKDIARKELELQQLKLAYEIIRKLESPSNPEEDNERAANEYDESHPEVKGAPPSPPPVANPVPPTYLQDKKPGITHRKVEIICSACEDPMYRAYKRVPSGVTVEYWQCSNTGCNNEMY